VNNTLEHVKSVVSLVYDDTYTYCVYVYKRCFLFCFDLCISTNYVYEPTVFTGGEFLWWFHKHRMFMYIIVTYLFNLCTSMNDVYQALQGNAVSTITCYVYVHIMYIMQVTNILYILFFDESEG
jgi:hypothetical protein